MPGPVDGGSGNVPVARNGPTLREYIERLLDDHAIAHKEHAAAHEREHRFAQAAIDTAAALAKETKRDANEWRDTMDDRERTFARVETVERITSEVDRRLAALERSNAQMVGALNVARFVGFGGLLAGASAIVWVATRSLT